MFDNQMMIIFLYILLKVRECNSWYLFTLEIFRLKSLYIKNTEKNHFAQIMEIIPVILRSAKAGNINEYVVLFYDL